MEVIVVPFDLCGKRLGSRLGPAAVRLAGLIKTLTEMGCTATDAGDIPVQNASEQEAKGLCSFSQAFDCVKKLKTRVVQSIATGEPPLVIGGDHFTAVGAISGALEAYGSDLALIWIDAHADLNTPGSSPSGNMHGMPVAALLGLPSGTDGLEDKQWSKVLDQVVPKTRLEAGHIAWLGLRETDAGEQEVLKGISNAFVSTMYDIDRYGLVQCVQNFDAWMRKSGAKKLWISFDVDALDPILAPGTGTTVHGGLSYREMHLLGELLYEQMSAKDCPYQLAGLDLVEVNPLFDNNNATAATAVEWIASLFGKTILGVRK